MTWIQRLLNTVDVVARGRVEPTIPFWPPAWIEWLQRYRVRAIIRHAYETVPFYRQAMDERGLRPRDFGSARDLSKLPLIDGAMVRKNIEAFAGENLDQIVAHCASCAAMLKLDYPLLFGQDDPFRTKALAFSEKVSDVSLFLAKVLGRPTADQRPQTADGRPPTQRLRVTYHDPCHLRRKLGIFKEPRDLLKSTPGLEYVEMKDANRCCGQGGSFNVANYDLSLKILDRKTKAIEESEAEVVTTTCSGCMLQLMDGIHQAGLKKEVRHLVEVIGSR